MHFASIIMTDGKIELAKYVQKCLLDFATGNYWSAFKDGIRWWQLPIRGSPFILVVKPADNYIYIYIYISNVLIEVSIVWVIQPCKSTMIHYPDELISCKHIDLQIESLWREFLYHRYVFTRHDYPGNILTFQFVSIQKWPRSQTNIFWHGRGI